MFGISTRRLHFLVGGAVAGVISRTVVAPLDRMHTLTVARSQEKTVDMLHEMLMNEGVLGLWRGNFVNCMKVAPTTAVKFFVTETLKRMAQKYYFQSTRIPFGINFGIGAVGAICSTLVSHPIDVIKTRMSIETTKIRKYDTFMGTAQTIIKEEGVLGLYKGINFAILSVTPFQAVNHACFEFVSPFVPQSSLKKLYQGCLSSSLAFSICYPLDVVKRKLLAKKADSVGEAVANILKNEGPIGFYRGFGVGFFKVVPLISVQFFAFDQYKKFFKL
ncbi:hypothetical protein EIN_291330 [Entamoeba invadens IP1]|uniref:Mitochondrial carrier protein n=2 Tax=Entamoeba invadens TaxID=33085 RepID=A0A0A1UFY3_ENTIV|nr:hypothetical protein EIN_291330 [Entamoeba invadens IP1]ELP92034.1 hypothetical protein EIN_291330 [Entamoeba invadens IP1]BAN40520.1 hypothetical protein, conserved [Entamoeba invadens]|eukprot:XP_004258805.1 hypothetical protein EIN_291330 [Entamoeba invadens IP1]